MITVTKVQVSYDLKIANIYISFLDNQKSITELMRILIKKKSIIRNIVSKEINLKYIPQLIFNYDDTMEHADNINQLLKIISQND